MRLIYPGLGIGLALLICAPACGGDDDDDTGTQVDGAPGSADGAPSGDASAGPDAGQGNGDASSGLYPLQLIRPACAPNDAPALRILLGSPIVDDFCAVNNVSSSANLEVWVTEIVAPMTITFAPTEAMGQGELCDADGSCRPFDTGEVHFDTYEESSGATGTWRLISGAEQFTGTFDATWCEPDPPEPDCPS